MKYCATLVDEPEGLAQFRAENPQETNWDRFRNDTPRYIELADALSARQRGICAFCESPLFTEIPTPVRQVEHWLPKSNSGNPTPAVSFGITNFHASCLGGTKRHLDPPFGTAGLQRGDNLSCGQKKADTNPSQIPLAERPYRPTELPLSPAVFTVQFDGALEADPEAAAVGLSVDRINATIRFLGLNCERLKYSRRAVRAYLDDLLMQYELDATDLDPVEATRGAMTRLASHLSPEPGENLNPFISSLRDYFGPALQLVLLRDPNWAVGEPA